MKLYVLSLVILPLLAFAQPVDAPYQEYVASMTSQEATIASVSVKIDITEAYLLDPSDFISCENIIGIEAKIGCYAEKYEVSPDHLLGIIKCESQFNPNARNVSRKEDSWGLSQINVRAHDVTVQQATDPDFAIDFLARHWKDGKREMWFNCSKKLGLL